MNSFTNYIHRAIRNSPLLRRKKQAVDSSNEDLNGPAVSNDAQAISAMAPPVPEMPVNKDIALKNESYTNLENFQKQQLKQKV